MRLPARIKTSESGQKKMYNREKVKSARIVGDTGLDAIPIVIPPQLQDLVIINNYDALGNRVLAFAPQWAIDFLSVHGQQIAIDGTFAVCTFHSF